MLQKSRFVMTSVCPASRLTILFISLCMSAASFNLSSTAWAYNLMTSVSCPNGFVYTEPPTIVLHMSEIESLDATETLALLVAMADVHDQFEQIGGSSLSIASFKRTDEPFTFGVWYGRENTIHVGFDKSLSYPAGAKPRKNLATCAMREAHIAVKHPDVYAWVWREPEDEGEDRWAAGQEVDGARYWRLTYTHELLHAFGLRHTNDSYSMLNATDRPWANRGPGDQFMPLPDDVEGLRALYPGSGERHDVAVLNTWFDPDDTVDKGREAKQKFLCAPSAGPNWGSRFDDLCGVDAGAPASTEVCPGDIVLTRVALANYGTNFVDVNMTLWWSLDARYSPAVDIPSSEIRSTSVSMSGSTQQGRIYTVPAAVAYDATYELIVHIDATNQVTGEVISDWTPLLGQITIKPAASCP